MPRTAAPPTRFPAATGVQAKAPPRHVAPPPVKFPLAAKIQMKQATGFAPPTRYPLAAGAQPKIAVRQAPKFAAAARRRGTAQMMEETVEEKIVVFERPKFEVPKVFKNYLEKAQINNEKLMTRIQMANDAITYTRLKLLVGAGNLEDQIEASSGWSAKLSALVVNKASPLRQVVGQKILSQKIIKGANTFFNAEGSKEFGTINEAATEAIAAKRLGAGVCDQFAGVAFFRLQKKQQSGTEIYRVSMTEEAGSHAVVVLADPDLSADQLRDSDSAIVVDAWPTNAFAICMAHWKYKDCKLAIKFKGSDIKEPNYLSVVRDAFKKPYQVDGEDYYRGFNGVQGSKTLYESYWKDADEMRNEYRQTPSEKLELYETRHQPVWKDKSALHDKLEKELLEN